MGMLKIEMYGSFPHKDFSTCAEEGGHVSALKRGIEFLAGELGSAVAKDVDLSKQGIDPPTTPFGVDTRDESNI